MPHPPTLKGTRIVLGPLHISKAGRTVHRRSDRTLCRSRNTWPLLSGSWQWRVPSLASTRCLRHHDSQVSNTTSCVLIQRCFRTQESMAQECRSLGVIIDVGIGRSTDSQHRLHYRTSLPTGLLSGYRSAVLGHQENVDTLSPRI
jgi:hypothetical protein